MQLKYTAAAFFLGAASSLFATARAEDAAPTPAQPASAAGERAPSPIEARVSLDSAGYADSDHVFVLTPSLAGSVANPSAGWRVGGQYLVDVVSAASVDIVSTASRNWVEVRHAGTLDAAYKPGATGIAIDGAVSSEPDYLSWTAGGVLSRDLFDANLTLLLGFGHGHDIAGRTGTSFTTFSRPLDRESLKAGASLVLDPATIGLLLVDAVLENGDPSKPYRYVPLFAPGTSVPRGASIDDVNALRVSARPLERLPQSRYRYALTLRVLHRFAHSTLRMDERLYTDSWALHATSSDARYLIDLGDRWELGPHLRLHAQTPVAFWQRAYVLRPGFDYPSLRTGDRELGPLLGLTLGLSARFGVGPARAPDAWRIGIDVNANETYYFDDLYIRRRSSALAVLSLEAIL